MTENVELNFYLLEGEDKSETPENILLSDVSVWESSSKNNATVSLTLVPEVEEKEETILLEEEEKVEESYSFEKKPASFVLNELTITLPKDLKNPKVSGLLWVMNGLKRIY
jgi:hypothetical protein